MLTGKVALVTGAGRGIGSAIATKLAENGAYVIVNYNGSKDAADQVVKQIEDAGGKAQSYRCNVADFEACSQMIRELIEEHKRMDILVNNAGITRDNLILGMTETEFDEVLAINLKGAFNTIRHLSRYLVKQRSGKIINISSVSGVMGNPGQANYCASKAGLIGLTKSVARELSGRGICVNAVAPGFIDTDMTRVLNEKVKGELEKQIPLKRMGKPEEIAEAVLFLAGSGSDYITGQVLSVDGGMAM